MNDQVETKVISIVASCMSEKQVVNLTSRSNLKVDCCLNSIDILDVIVKIEEEFGFEFDVLTLDLSTFDTIDNIVKKICDCLLVKNINRDMTETIG